MQSDSLELQKVADGLNFPEGPAWDGAGTLYVSNCKGDWISKITAEGADVFLKAAAKPFTFEKTNGMTVFKDHYLYACEFGRGAILKISPAGKTEIFAAGYQGKRFNRPNDLAFDPAGNLYFTDPNHYRRENPDGVVYRVAVGTGQVTPVASKLAFPNGIAFSADGKTLFVCESVFERVLKFTVNSDGSLSNQQVFVVLPGGDPDGINLDQAGNLYVAHFGGGAICVVSPDGSVIQKIPTPGKRPTNVEFGGKDLRTLYITETETGAVYQATVKIPGLPLSRINRK